MLNFEAAATPTPRRNDALPVTYLVGESLPRERRPLRPYDDRICDVLAGLSQELLSRKEARQYPDVVAFGFWCRRANLKQLQQRFVNSSGGQVRRGVGLAFHVAPSNVPVNFAYSLVLGMLAGNANVVRAPSRSFPQVDLICEALNTALAQPTAREFRPMTAVVRYERNDGITAELSAVCQARVLWGGDDAIRHMRTIPLPARAVELAFADRYSICVLDAHRLASDGDLGQLAAGFYNDAYSLDQNGCNSPHVVLWLGSEAEIRDVSSAFWREVFEAARARYRLAPIVGIDKLTRLCVDAAEGRCAGQARRYGNLVYVVPLGGLPQDLHTYRGAGGYFYEVRLETLDDLARVVNDKFQTLTYAGLPRDRLVRFVTQNRLAGVDRIVPVGRAMDMSVIWDGYDIVRTLSRICDVE